LGIFSGVLVTSVGVSDEVTVTALLLETVPYFFLEMEIVACVFQVMGTVAYAFLETGTSVCRLAICAEQVICGVQEMVIS
jgi:uncharacterized membrane protein